jgi:anti-sigma-K factor RskA
MIHRHQMTCAHFADVASAFALDVLDEHEQQACARHIMRTVHHVECREALASARGVMDMLAATLPATTPPPRLWTAIESRLGLASGSSNAEWL